MSRDDDGDNQHPTGENSTIRIGLGLVLASYIAMSSWWASSISSKLSMVVSGQQVYAGEASSMRSKIENLERVSEQFTQFGSPALRLRIDALEKFSSRVDAVGSPPLGELSKRVTQLERDLELYKASDKKGN